MYDPQHITATGNVGAASGGTLQSVILSADEAAASLTLKEGGAGGTTFLTVTAPEDETTAITGLCAVYHGQLHATLSGTGATATVVI